MTRGNRARVIASRFLAAWMITFAMAFAGHPEPDEVVEQWVASQAGIESLEGEFVQTRKLPALRVPLKSEGMLWMAKGGFFRWQTGNPPGVVLLRTGRDAWLAWPRRREFQKIDLQRADAAEWLVALEFPGGMDPEEFHRRFEVLDVSIDWVGGCRVELLPRETKAREFVKSIVLRFMVEGGAVMGFEICLKDGSVLNTEFRNVRVNQPVDWSVFRIDTSGWREVGS